MFSLLRASASQAWPASLTGMVVRGFSELTPDMTAMPGHGYMGTGGTTNEEEVQEPRYLVTGAAGQIGLDLVPYLRKRVGVESVIASDVKTSRQLIEGGHFAYLDICDKDSLTRIAIEHGVTHIIHLATLLSAVGERSPQLALKVNTAGIHNVLDLAAQHGLAVYAPSTIAVFGDSSPKTDTPNDTVMQPNTMYGVTKVHQELLGAYYKRRFGVDYRSLRYPGIVSANTAGGGTTDYAVDMFQKAIRTGSYQCFLSPDARLPMMYLPDALEATWQLIRAPASAVAHCTTFNVGAFSFSPAELAAAIQTEIPDFKVTYTPDYRDAIASSWPQSVDDSLARQSWGWQPRYNLLAMTKDMLRQVRLQVQREESQARKGPAGQQNMASKSLTAAVAVPAEVL